MVRNSDSQNQVRKREALESAFTVYWDYYSALGSVRATGMVDFSPVDPVPISYCGLLRFMVNIT